MPYSLAEGLVRPAGCRVAERVSFTGSASDRRVMVVANVKGGTDVLQRPGTYPWNSANAWHHYRVELLGQLGRRFLPICSRPARRSTQLVTWLVRRSTWMVLLASASARPCDLVGQRAGDLW